MRRPDQIERLYIDFDSFFASAEQHLRPEWRGRPIGVRPLDSDYTSLIAASREAKLLGIKTGTSVAEARALCPGIPLPVARHDIYVDLHHAIFKEIDRHVPVLKRWSIDEGECALIGRERDEAVDIAHRIKAGLAENIGSTLTASIGLTANSMLAKVGAEMNKPDGLVVLRPEDMPGALSKCVIEDFPGIGPRMGKRLRAAGIENVEQLWALAPKQARALWGSVEGERFRSLLHGYALERPGTQTSAFGHGRVLASDWRTPAKALACARLLCAKAARRMRRSGFAARRLSLNLRAMGENAPRWSGEIELPAARDDRTILSALKVLFLKGLRDSEARRFRQVSVMLSRLVPLDQRIGDLFTDTRTARDQVRWEAVTDVIDGLNEKFKTSVISVGPRDEPPGGYAGAKIAFGRVPDRADFW